MNLHKDKEEIKNLIEKGFTEDQAEAITSLIIRCNNRIDAVQEGYMEFLTCTLQKEIEMIKDGREYEIRSKIKDFKHEMNGVFLMVCLIGGLIGAVGTALYYYYYS